MSNGTTVIIKLKVGPNLYVIDRFNIEQLSNYFRFFSAEDSEPVDPGICGKFLTGCAWALVAITFPFSLFVCFKVSIKLK